MNKTAYFVFLLLLGMTFIALVNLAWADWRACIDMTPIEPISWKLLLPPQLGAVWLYYLPVLPMAALSPGKQTPDRRTWTAAILLLAMGLWFMLPSDAMHDCDRKGSNAEFYLFFLTLVSFLVMLTVFMLRSKESSRK